jgi:hypothetical protein
MTAFTAGRLALLAPALLLAGCAGQGQVSGKVHYKGKPLPTGTITFYDQKNNAVSSPIGPDGGYAVEKVAAGPVKITVVTPMAIYMAGDKPPPGPPPPTLPTKYADANKSGLNWEVKSGSQAHDVDLD